MAILSKSFNGHIYARCAGCSRKYSAYYKGEIRDFYANRKKYRKDLCRICISAKIQGYFEYECAGCKKSVKGSLDDVRDHLNIRDLPMCRSCMEGYYGSYNKKNQALMIALEAIENKKFRKPPRHFQKILDYRQYEADYHRLVRNKTRQNYRLNKTIINTNDLFIAPSGIEGGHHVDHIVSITLCFSFGI